jgi:anti-sigma factor RsiW
MVKLGAGKEERDLWRRWRARGEPQAAAPGAALLAAYADYRLSESEAEPVESWLADHPAAWPELVALRAAVAAPAASADADEAMIARACGLVADREALAPGSNVVPLRRPPVRGWRNALAWSSVAASLVAVSLVGFTMGSDAYQSLAGLSGGDSAQATVLDSFDAPTTIDSYLSGESGT